jgi:hypothetical protein
MKSQTLVLACLTSSLLLPVVALAKDPVPPPGEWQAVADTAGQTAYLDVSSLEQTDKGLKAAVKINYAAPQTFGKKTFQSVRNVYILDCAARRLADRQNAIYAGQDLTGKRISYASRDAKNFVWRDAPVASIDGELLTSACKRAKPAG